MAIIGDRDYWSYPSGRSVRLYTDGCVVDSSTGLMGLCMILNQKKLKGLVAAIALFKQASETTTVPVQHNTVQTTKVICHDPWVSFVLTLLTTLGIVCYMYKHGRQLTLLYGHKFSNICKVMFLYAQGLTLSKSKLLVWEAVQACSK